MTTPSAQTMLELADWVRDYAKLKCFDDGTPMHSGEMLTKVEAALRASQPAAQASDRVPMCKWCPSRLACQEYGCRNQQSQAPAGTGGDVREVRMTEDQIKHMVNRFLGWKLPENFSPDAGISFKRRWYDDGHKRPDRDSYPMPRGTNLFDATQADAMVRYMIDGLVALSPSQAQDAVREALKAFMEGAPENEYLPEAGVDYTEADWCPHCSRRSEHHQEKHDSDCPWVKGRAALAPPDAGVK